MLQDEVTERVGIDLLLSPREVKLASRVTSQLSVGAWLVQVIFINPDPAERPHIVLRGRAILITPAALRLLDGHRRPLLQGAARSGPLLALVDPSRTADVLEIPDEVAGIVFVDEMLANLKDVIELAESGYQVFPAEAMYEMLDQKHRRELIDALPKLEREVLALVGKGRSNKEISQSLQIPETGVKSMVRAILRKLRFQNRTEAAVFLNRFDVALG